MAISKMIQSRLDNAGVIGASVETHNPAISEALYSQLLPLCEQGETLSKDQLLLMLQLLHRNHQSCAKDMREAEQAYNEELGDDTGSRKQLDLNTNEVYALVRDFKKTTRGSYGEDFLVTLQIQGRTPSEPTALSQQAGLLVKWLRDKSKSFPPKTNAFSSGIKKQDALSILEPKVKALDLAIALHKKEKRETESSMLAKNESIAVYDANESQTVSIFKGLMLMCGMDEEARRLKPGEGSSSKKDDAPVVEVEAEKPASS